MNPLSVFVKKKDAENHVALLAIKKLKEKGYFDEYLFPVTSHPVFQFSHTTKILPSMSNQSFEQRFVNKSFSAVQPNHTQQQ